MNKEKILLKEKYFNEETVKFLTNLIKNVYPKFNEIKFKEDILKKFPKLELKERFFFIRENIEKYLPKDYLKTLNILIKSLENIPKNENFVFISYCDYIEKNGCCEKYLEESFNALEKITVFSSAEFAIRVFLNKYPIQTFKKMKEWSYSENYHLRRLASEGLRPKLPWAMSINFNYIKGSKILDNLFYDKYRYVTRSVANHLNDISKINPEFTIEKLKKFKESKKQNETEINYIISHSLRTLIKKGNPQALNFLGYNLNPQISISKLNIKNKIINLNEYLEFSFEIFAKENEKLIIDYIITYQTLNKRHSNKVFKIKTIKIIKNTKIKINKKYLFKKMTTKKLYEGIHKLEIQINGKQIEKKEFELKIN